MTGKNDISVISSYVLVQVDLNDEIVNCFLVNYGVVFALQIIEI